MYILIHMGMDINQLNNMDSKKKLKVLMIGSDLSVKGGMTTVVENFTAKIDRNIVQYDFIPTHIEGSKVKKLLFFIKNYFKIKKHLNKYDVFHIHMSERGSYIRKAMIIRLLKKHDKKVILHHHGPEFSTYYEVSSVKRKSHIKRTLSMVDLNLVLSNQMKEAILTIEPNAITKVLYNGVHVPNENHYSNRGNIILFLGKIGDRKGAFDLFEAIKVLDSKLDSNIKFYFCGNGEVDKLNQLIIENHLETRIPHVGWINGDLKQEILDHTLINVLPSYFEGLPMTILETMALGIPNISTKINAIPEVILNESLGFLGNPGDINYLVNKIELLALNPDLRKIISKNSYKQIKNNFNIDTLINDLQSIYLHL